MTVGHLGLQAALCARQSPELSVHIQYKARTKFDQFHDEGEGEERGWGVRTMVPEAGLSIIPADKHRLVWFK